MKIPFPLLTDSYKATFHPFYPKGLERMHSYFESRGGHFPAVTFFGLQGILQEYFTGVRVTADGIKEAASYLTPHFGRDLMHHAGWLHVIKQHGGRLPLVIKAVPEGTSVPVSNVLMTVENTCDACAWLVDYMETLLVQTWYPTTVATISREAKKIILRYLERTGRPELIDFKLHDFGFRGTSSVESAAIGGCAHLLNFKGTDTLPALVYARTHYGAACAGHSIPATQHSIMTINGPKGELDALRRVLAAYPSGPLACVGDSYDMKRFTEDYVGRQMREQILARDGVFVGRPDSGYPPKEVRDLHDRFGVAFGSTTNEKGYRVLDAHVAGIQGDGVGLDPIEECLHQLQTGGWSTDSAAFGMGGGLLQKCDRDTQKFAFKLSWRQIDGAGRDVYKQPVGDGSKASKRGRQALVKGLGDAEWQTVTQERLAVLGATDALVEVFRDGDMTKTWTLDECRAHAAIPSVPLALTT